MSALTIEINGPLFPYSENDSRLIAAQIKEAGNDAHLTVNVHSPGGSVWEGKKLFQLFLNHGGPVDMYVTLAASAASYMATAGDRLFIYNYSEWMVHSAMVWFDFFGNAAQLEAELPNIQKEIKNLRSEDEKLAQIYSDRTGIELDNMKSYMDEETTWYGKDILNVGFATDFVETPQRDKTNLAKFDLTPFEMHRKSAFHDAYGEGIPSPQAWTAQGDTSASQETPPVAVDKLKKVAQARAAARQRQLELQKHVR